MPRIEFSYKAKLIGKHSRADSQLKCIFRHVCLFASNVAAINNADNACNIPITRAAGDSTQDGGHLVGLLQH